MNTYLFPVPDSCLTVQVTFDQRKLAYEYADRGRSLPANTLSMALMLAEPEMRPAQRLQVIGMVHAEIGKWAADPEDYTVSKGIAALEGVIGE